MNLLQKLIKIYDRILDVAVVLSGILLIFLMLSVGLEVCMRYFLDRPTSWVVEIAGYILLYIPFLVAAWVLKKEGHVKMDFVFSKLSPRSQALLNGITSIVCVLICLVLTWYGIKVAWYFHEMNYKTPTVLMLPKSIIISIIFLGSFLLGLQFVRRSFDCLRRWKALRKDESER